MISYSVRYDRTRPWLTGLTDCCDEDACETEHVTQKQRDRLGCETIGIY